MATIRDVAQRAGVSPAVVSRVINGHLNIRTPTRASVEKAIEELGYKPKPRGRTPGFSPQSRTSTKRVWVVTQNPDEVSINESFYSSFYQHFQMECNKAGLEVSLKAASNFNIETDETIFGIVSVGVPLSLSQFESPHLQAMGLINDMDMIDRVSYHNTSIGAIVAEAMAKRNCKKVAVLSRDTPLCLERKRTFCLEAEAHGMHVMPFEPKLQDAYKAYSQHTNLPDAIFATEDSYLPALYAVLAMQNIKPMEDLLIIGCNAQKSVLYQCQPTPWSVDLQLPAIATHCLNQLNMRRAHPNHPPVHISLTPVLNKGEPLCSVTL